MRAKSTTNPQIFGVSQIQIQVRRSPELSLRNHRQHGLGRLAPADYYDGEDD
jgi:hypothetical protein